MISTALVHWAVIVLFFKEEIFDDIVKTKRPKTRIALAKKQLNKGVKLNTKVVFNDEGEVRYLLNEKKKG